LTRRKLGDGLFNGAHRLDLLKRCERLVFANRAVLRLENFEYVEVVVSIRATETCEIGDVLIARFGATKMVEDGVLQNACE